MFCAPAGYKFEVGSNVDILSVLFVSINAVPIAATKHHGLVWPLGMRIEACASLRHRKEVDRGKQHENEYSRKVGCDKKQHRAFVNEFLFQLKIPDLNTVYNKENEWDQTKI